MKRYSLSYWEQRLDVADWVKKLRADPTTVLQSTRTLWRLEELHALAVAATDATDVTAHALARMLKACGFRRVSAYGVRTTDGQVRLWRIGAPALSPTNAGARYNEENGQ